MNWKQFQVETADVFKSAGCDAEIEKTIEGVRGCHEVDVYVTFEKYGIQCQWIIECKCWNSNVPKEKVAALQTIVSDVGADRGVIISKLGFQSGAIRLAQKSNITLASLEDLKDYIQEELDRRRLVSHWVHPCRVSITQWTRLYRRSALPRPSCVRDDVDHHSHNDSTPFHGYRGLSALVSTLPGRQR